jgi:hypothetical protein
MVAIRSSTISPAMESPTASKRNFCQSPDEPWN